MRHQLKIIIGSLFIFPCCTFSLSIGDYFQQGLKVHNHSSQTIVINDVSTPELQNIPVTSWYARGMEYASDQYTVLSGQTFSHTVDIYSGADYKLICTVKSNLMLGPDEYEFQATPTSTDELICVTSAYSNYSSGGLIFWADVVVNDQIENEIR